MKQSLHSRSVNEKKLPINRRGPGATAPAVPYLGPPLFPVTIRVFLSCSSKLVRAFIKMSLCSSKLPKGIQYRLGLNEQLDNTYHILLFSLFMSTNSLSNMALQRGGKNFPTNSKLLDNKECNKEYNSEDRISPLPDEILVLVLSFLTLKEAAITSVLARRWMYLWASVSNLYFDATKSLEKATIQEELHLLEMKKYVNLVNRVMELHNGPTLNDFKVLFDLDKSSEGDINEWLKFALSKRVQRLELDLSKCFGFRHDSSMCYTFPVQVPSRGPSHSPSPFFLGMNPCSFVGFNSLKVLRLKCVHVKGEVVECIISICSVLQSLYVSNSHDFGSLKVTGPSLMLKRLEICYCYGIDTIEICDTNLISFVYEGQTIILLLKIVPLLAEVCLGGIMSLMLIPLGRDMSDRVHFGSQLSCYLSQLETLSLEIDSPVLTWNGVNRSGTLKKKALKMPHQHLKVLEFAGYYGRRSDFELAMYFLENAVALEKMVIDPCDQDFDEILLERKYLTKTEKEEIETARSLAHQQLKGKESSGVELVIL